MGREIPTFITQIRSWHDRQCNAPHLILAPSVMNEGPLLTFESPARLQIPKERLSGLTERLLENGVDPKRWFVVIHYREPTYSLRPARRFRDASAKPFQELTNRIIQELGGQVVRVGHPSMTPFPEQDGFVDLSGVDEDAFDLHTFAISRARFMVAASSGPLQIAFSLGTPTARANSITPAEIPGAWNEHDLVLHRNLFCRRNPRSVEDALAAGFFN